MPAGRRRGAACAGRERLVAMKILIAFDGSHGAESAVDEVLRRPWPMGSEVKLVWAIELPVSVASLADPKNINPEWARNILNALREAYERRLAEVAARFADRPDLEVGVELRDPGVTRSLLGVVAEWKPDLVVAGSQRSTVLGRVFLGSVAHALVSHAPCSVLIVKTPPVKEHHV
jgi:nucleotide-binding universal stress UspA family protein